ncbi:hypothetical protein ACWEKM_00330 [Streptomyces sp. NPDC004752]
MKIAPFDRYRTADVIRAVGAADRAAAVTLYTGNDDDIIGDLLTPYDTADGRRWFAGGLLGQWAVWTRSAVALLDDVRAARAGDHEAMVRCLARRRELTDANQAAAASPGRTKYSAARACWRAPGAWTRARRCRRGRRRS